MAKNAKLKIGKKTLKKIILEMSVDSEGNKISDRKLWGSTEFMEATGLFRINKYTSDKEMVSLGTCTYWKKKLDLTAKSVFEYHQYVTGRIDALVLFKEWNLKTSVKSMESGVVSEKTKKNNLIRDFELKDKVYSTYTLKELESAIIELYNELGLDGVAELKEYYGGSK